MSPAADGDTTADVDDEEPPQDLIGVADRIYGLPLTEFTGARDAASKRAGDRDLAARVKRLRKPTVAAWTVNLLVRHEQEQIDQVLTLGTSLREAAEALDGDELRDLTRQRRRLTAALAETARGLAREHGARLTPAVVDQVEGILTAAMLDPAAAAVVRSGLVLAAFTSTGVGELDVEALVAVPGGAGHRAPPAAPAPRPGLAVVRPDARVLREVAQERLAEAEEALDVAEQALAVHEERLAEAEAARLQVRAELDEARRRVADLEARLDDVDARLESAETERDDAAHDATDATDALTTARASLDALPTGDG